MCHSMAIQWVFQKDLNYPFGHVLPSPWNASLASHYLYLILLRPGQVNWSETTQHLLGEPDS